MNIGWPFGRYHYHMPIRTRSGDYWSMGGERQFRQVGIAIALFWSSSLLYGCVAQQADLNKVDRDLRQASVRIKQQADELEKTRARQSQDIMNIRDAMPALEGKLDEAIHHAKLLQQRQEDLIVQQSKLDKRLSDSEKRVSENEKKVTDRLGWAEQQLVNQEQKSKADRDQTKSEIAALKDGIDKLGTHIESVQKAILESVQKTNVALLQKVDGRLDEQQKMIHANESRMASITQLDAQNKALADQVGKLNLALGDFKQALGSLGEKVIHQEQATKQVSVSVDQDTAVIAKRTDALAAKIDADNKATMEHLNEVNRSVASVAKALENAGGKFVSRGDEQEKRLEESAKEVAHLQAQIQTLGQNMENQHAFLKQVEQHLHALDKNYDNHQVFLKQVEQHLTARVNTPQRSDSGMSLAEAATPPVPAIPPVSVAEPPTQSAGSPPSSGQTHAAVLSGDREAYERVLTRFKEGDLDRARQGFAEFLVQHPHSDFAPNARFWLGESYYGKKDYPRAIDAYDQVQLNHPTSEKVPAALLKKGYAYLALKDRKRAASTLKQVIDLYPRSPEANKAIDKLNQLKELH
jgi:tol-pal system protein YbgF